MSTLFAGLDWASRIHALCIVDERGGVVERSQARPDVEGEFP